MSDVVLKNKEGVEQTYEDTHAVLLNTPDGGEAVYREYQTDYEQNDETAADYMKNRPFYDSSVPLIEYGEKSFVTSSTQNGISSTATFVEPIGLVVGQTYKVKLDGVEHVCECKTYVINNNDALILGDLYTYLVYSGFEDTAVEQTNEPFTIVYNSANALLGAVAIWGETEDTTHSIGVYKPGEIKKLDKKFLPDDIEVQAVTSWNNLTDKPFEDVKVIFEWDGDITGRECVDAGDGMYMVKVSDNPLTTEQIIGGTITMVQTDGDGGILLQQPIVVSENILMIEGSMIAVGPYLISVVDDQVIPETEITLTKGLYSVFVGEARMKMYVSSFVSGKLKTLDPKFLPFGTSYIIEAIEMLFWYDGTFGMHMSSNVWVGNSPLINGEKYIVTWDGTDYECIAQEGTFDGNEGIAIGNPAFLAAGDNNGIPFVIGMSEAVMVVLTSDASGTTDDVYHTVSIRQENPIPVDYLPDIRWDKIKTAFDGEVVSKEQSYTFVPDQLLGIYVIYPLDSIQAVKLTVGETYVVTWDGTDYECVAQEASFGGYTGIGIGNFAFAGMSNTGEPFLFGSTDNQSTCFTTSTDASHTISITKKPNAAVLPSVTTADNGKIAEVVNGEWKAVTFEESQIKAYIDSLLNITTT